MKEEDRPKLCFVTISTCDSKENHIDCFQYIQSEKICAFHEEYAIAGLKEHCNFVSTLRQISSFGAFEHQDYTRNDTDNPLAKSAGKSEGPENAKYQLNLDDIAEITPRDCFETFLVKAPIEQAFCNLIVIGHGKKFLELVLTLN